MCKTAVEFLLSGLVVFISQYCARQHRDRLTDSGRKPTGHPAKDHFASPPPGPGQPKWIDDPDPTDEPIEYD